jgi:hypothetical protein
VFNAAVKIKMTLLKKTAFHLGFALFSIVENGQLVISSSVVGMDFSQSLDTKTVARAFVNCVNVTRYLIVVNIGKCT